jgi:hypothetical protein
MVAASSADGVTFVETKVAVGNFGALNHCSPLRRPLRGTDVVSTVSIGTVTSSLARSIFAGSSSNVPDAPENIPRKLLNPKCVMENSTCVWFGSIE